MIILASLPLLVKTAHSRYMVPDDVVAHPIFSIHSAQTTTSPQGYNVTQIRNAYNLPSSGGSRTIAIIDAYDDPTAMYDLNVFSSYYNLTLVTNTTFVKHEMAPSIPEGSEQWLEEISGDVQWAHAIAPEAKILLVEAQSSYLSDLISAIDYANNKTINPDVVAISMSWGCTETIDITNYATEQNADSHLMSNTTAFFAASGDAGYRGNFGDYPAVSPYVIACGGTSLTINANGSVTETGWNLSGGCRSMWEPEPLFQTAYGVPVIAYRADPDVSFFADPNPGVPIYVSYNSSKPGWIIFDGTSLATCCWAGIHSLGLSCSNNRFYKLGTSQYYSSDFRDITIGNNGQSCLVGWDYVTGLGSPLTIAFKGGLGDINLDGTVNILDHIPLGLAFSSSLGDSNWNAAADLNNDSAVNILDAIIMSNNFGKNYTYGSASGMSSQLPSAGPMNGSGTSVLVDPSQITVFKGDVFTVNVNVTGVTDLRGWEFKLYWNSTVLNCTNAAVVTPPVWQGYTGDDGPGLQPNYNSTHSRFWKAEAANYPAPSFNGSMTVATLTFQAMQPGTTALTLMDTILGNSMAQPIACSVSSGSVTVYRGRYMRSDTQTVNGLNAYKLNIPESTSSTSAKQSGPDGAPSWGIRVWVRHSDGSETEVVLDGQTGTPKAVVSRSSGSGIQSATTSISQTVLQSTDSLVVRVYTQLDSAGWTLCATFTTEQLQATTLRAATWTVYYYTSASFNRVTGTYTGTFYWGTTTYNSRVQNLQYT
jgi:hypothetical protein